MDKENYITKLESMDGVWLSSDTHWSHGNILKYCNRPFETVEEMNQALIDNWNSVVGKDDHVYHLGDFCFGNVEKWNSILKPGVLNGNIHLILGNHDIPRIFKENIHRERFCEIAYQKMLLVDGWTIFLNHFPFLDFSNSIDYKIIALCGHVHYNGTTTGTLTDEKLKLFQWNQYDVGVDNNNYTPISLEKVFEKIKFQRDNDVNMSCWYKK
jgi:calcineurin-like phosphoesterase family protein